MHPLEKPLFFSLDGEAPQFVPTYFAELAARDRPQSGCPHKTLKACE